jgi:hypothetical protein
MPSFVSPALTQTANGSNMYVPITGDVVVLPPVIEGTPITSGPTGLPPFVQSLTGTRPITINENVRVEYTGTGPTGPTGPSYNLPLNALTVNGPVRMTYDAVPSIPDTVALNIVGDMAFDTLSANILEAVKLFNIPITFKLFTDEYGMQEMSVFDMGGLRFVFGNTNLGRPVPEESDNAFYMDFASIAPNTIPNQSQTGLFVGKCNCIAMPIFVNDEGVDMVNTYSVNNQENPGSVNIYTDYVVDPPGATARWGFLAIGIAKV